MLLGAFLIPHGLAGAVERNEADALRGASMKREIKRELREKRSLRGALGVVLAAQLLQTTGCPSASLTVFGCLGPTVLTQHIALPCISYFILPVIISHWLLRPQSWFFKYLVSLPFINVSCKCATPTCLGHYLLHLSISNLCGNAFFFFFRSNSFLKKDKSIQLWVDFLWFFFTPVMLDEHISWWLIWRFIALSPCDSASRCRNLLDTYCKQKSSFLAIPKRPHIFSCQNQQMQNHNPYMSHFQLMQAQLVPATDFISWNVKCHSLSSLPPASFNALLAILYPPSSPRGSRFTSGCACL